jgi:hypothetical protein
MPAIDTSSACGTVYPPWIGSDQHADSRYRCYIDIVRATLFFSFVINSSHHLSGAVRDGNRCAAASGTSVGQLAKGNVASFEFCYRVLRANKTA